MPKPLFELAPEWGEQPRKAPPLPAKSDLRRVTEGQFGQFGEILIPFRCKSRARGSVSSGNVDELYLACERAVLRSGRRPSGGLVGRSTAQVHAAQTIGATFAPLPSVNTILRPVSSATTAKSPLSASPEAPPTATSIASPIFGNMNPLPALRRAMSDLIPQRPAYPYDPLFDNYAPEQPFHIQWRRGGVDGQQSPVTTHLASPPIRS
ncbi:hypothetical protein MCOR08_001228 [Pyricularia oryzae]|nr:hypothetical protein MCOR08_001228 [Pyricularia oryzae]